MTGWLGDLRTRLEFGQGSATLLLLIAEHDTALDETRRLLIELLRVTPLAVEDLGVSAVDAGPRRWAELTRSRPADAYVLTVTPASVLSLRPMAVLYNAERELLRELAGPVVLLVSSATEQAIREHAADFFTWVAMSYVLPGTRELAALATQAGVAEAVVEPPVPEEEPIRFLHISDVHLRPARRYDQDRVLRGLVEFLERDRAGFPLDLIFVTGDLSNTGKADEYVLVVEFLKRLMEVTGVPPEHMFVVPGNHDVDREVGRWLLRTLSKDEEAVAFFEEAKSRAFHLKKLEAYAESMRALFGKERALGLAVGEEAVEIVDVRGSRLAVASFNSAWFAQGDDDRGKLWLGEPNVNLAGQRIADEEAPFAVALLHHPFDDLHEIERDTVEHYFERSFEVVLRGHLHKDKTQAIATQRGGFVEVAGPAAYQGSQWPNGCFLGEIRTGARTVRLWPYAYASPTDGWVLDAKVFPDDEKDGYRHTFAVAEKRRLKSAVTKRLERVAEETVRKASPTELRKMAEQLGVTKPGEDVPRDLVQQTAKVARAHAEDPVLWRDAGEASASRGLLKLAAGIVADVRRGSAHHISRDEPRFLENALSDVARVFSQVRECPEGQGEWTEVMSPNAWAIAVDVLEGPMTPRSKSPWTIWLVGASGEPDDRHAVILENTYRPSADPAALAAGLRVLDSYLTSSHAAHGALVLFTPGGPPKTAPPVEHVTTPAGRDVLLLRL